jgi:hypothetical protein
MFLLDHITFFFVRGGIYSIKVTPQILYINLLCRLLTVTFATFLYL